MFRQFRKAMGKAARLARPGGLVSATLALQKRLLTGASLATKPGRALRKARPAPKARPVASVPTGNPDLPPGATFKTLSFSNDHGKRRYRLYVPSTARKAGQLDTAMPLVLMLHGCTQTPLDFAAGTGMNRLAESGRFLVAYPAQPASANARKCWNWFRKEDQSRDAGEPAVIAGLTRRIVQTHPVDARRIYIAGLSAGGAAALAAAHAYPDIYAAVAVHSGLPLGAAQDGPHAFFAMRAGASGRKLDVAVPTISFHGDADDVVHPRNGRSVAARALATFDGLTAEVKTSRKRGKRGVVQTAHRGSDGKSWCEHWEIQGAGHAWSGGKASGSFTDPTGPDASREMLRFFRQHSL